MKIFGFLLNDPMAVEIDYVELQIKKLYAYILERGVWRHGMKC